MPSGPSGSALVQDLQCGRSIKCTSVQNDPRDLNRLSGMTLGVYNLRDYFGAKLDLKAHDDKALAAADDEYWCEGQTCRQHEALLFKATQLFFEAVYDVEGGMCQGLPPRLLVCQG